MNVVSLLRLLQFPSRQPAIESQNQRLLDLLATFREPSSNPEIASRQGVSFESSPDACDPQQDFRRSKLKIDKPGRRSSETTINQTRQEQRSAEQIYICDDQAKRQARDTGLLVFEF